ncbi:hypothetical protein GEMRC1_011763 [Eukaryota sp. GEM-RC1]
MPKPDHVIHSRGELGVPKSKKTALTKPKSPLLNTSRRHEQHAAKLQLKIEEERRQEEELRKFKASSPQLEDTAPVNYIPPAKPTKAYSPKFRVNIRHQLHSMKQQSARQREEELNASQRFKARPTPLSHSNPFIPEPSNDPLTISSDPHLHTKERSSQRKEFDESQLLRMSQIEEEKKALEQLQKKKKNVSFGDFVGISKQKPSQCLDSLTNRFFPYHQVRHYQIVQLY